MLLEQGGAGGDANAHTVAASVTAHNMRSQSAFHLVLCCAACAN